MAGLRRLPALTKSPRPKRLRPLPVEHAQGPRPLGLANDPAQVAGPGQPPPGFVGAATSKSEWVFYWAIAKALNDPPDPRRPPFRGGRDWDYQKAALNQGGLRSLGSAIIDFVVYLPRARLGIRLQSSRFHVNASARQHAFDERQFANLSRLYTVVDVYEQDFIPALRLDPTGQAAIQVAKDAIELGRSPRIDVLKSGRAVKVRGPQ
jgi:hypothetical protein